MSQTKATNVLSIVPQLKAKIKDSNPEEVESFLVLQIPIKSSHKTVQEIMASLDPVNNHSLYEFIDDNSCGDFVVHMFKDPIIKV